MPKRTDRLASAKPRASAGSNPPVATDKPPTRQQLDAVLVDCNAVIAAMIGDYLVCAQADLAILKNAAQALSASGGAAEDIALVHRTAHDLKGLGGSIGFPLLTTVGASLCDLLHDRQTADDGVRGLVDHHVAAIELILTKPIMGDGGLEGAALLQSLRSACETENA
jgi:hypothetical protein